MAEYINIGNDKALLLEEWKGNYSISQHHLYNEKWYWDAVRTVKGKDQVSDKNSPAKVQLGPKETAVATCLLILKELTGMDYTEVPF